MRTWMKISTFIRALLVGMLGALFLVSALNLTVVHRAHQAAAEELQQKEEPPGAAAEFPDGTIVPLHVVDLGAAMRAVESRLSHGAEVEMEVSFDVLPAAG